MSKPLFLSRSYWRYGFSAAKTFDAVFAAFGVLWLTVEIASFFSDPAATWLKAQWPPFLVAGIIYAGWKARPVLRVSHRLTGRDTRIEIRVGDLFSVPGAVVIST